MTAKLIGNGTATIDPAQVPSRRKCGYESLHQIGYLQRQSHSSMIFPDPGREFWNDYRKSEGV
jgi:hypothetical protein